uniref:Uncharacterized protein n=1 Tax=Lactuca sativa TaxID=4236 RepID=A0A9R1VTZ2_LACSA|nr:hypothetical protein LSAT_V11C400203120 [Lactuca sativa]
MTIGYIICAMSVGITCALLCDPLMKNYVNPIPSSKMVTSRSIRRNALEPWFQKWDSTIILSEATLLYSLSLNLIIREELSCFVAIELVTRSLKVIMELDCVIKMLGMSSKIV